MEYTELSAYDVPPGVVATWMPSAPDEAWRDDPRGLSPNHEQHLAASEDGSWIGCIMRLPAPLDADALRVALRAWTARHESLRSTVVPGRGDQWQRRLLPAEAIAVETRDLGRRSGEEAQALIADTLATVGPIGWPHCLFVTVAEPDAEEFVLAFGADHSVMDAYSQLLWFDEIAGLYERALAGEGPAELDAVEVGSHLDHAHAERTHAETLTADAEPVERWRAFLGGDEPGASLRFPTFPVADVAQPVGHHDGVRTERGRLKQAGLATWLADADQTAVLNGLCRSAGTSLQSGVLAAMAHAFREVHGVERTRFVLPMHTRFSPEHATAIGWYVGLAPVDLDLAGAATLPEIVGRVHAAVAAGKDLVPHPFAQVGRLLGTDAAPHFAVSYVDSRFVPGADRWDEWQGRALRSPAYADDEVYLWFGRTHDGLNLSARYPETITAERAMRDLIGGITDVIEAVTRPHLAAGTTLETTA